MTEQEIDTLVKQATPEEQELVKVAAIKVLNAQMDYRELLKSIKKRIIAGDRHE